MRVVLCAGWRGSGFAMCVVRRGERRCGLGGALLGGTGLMCGMVMGRGGAGVICETPFWLEEIAIELEEKMGGIRALERWELLRNFWD